MSGGDCKLWLHRDGDVVCGDTHGGNILVTKTGALVAIDVPVMRRRDFPGELRPC